MSTESPDFVTALARGLTVLKVFSSANPEMTLAEVAQAAGVPPATARRSLLTLETLGYVRTHGRRFLLTPRVLDLSASFLASMNLQQVAQQYLQDVADQTGDSSSLAALDGTDVVYLASVPAKRAIRLTAGIGTRYPAYATSMGRAILGHLDFDKRDAVIDASNLTALTSKTVTDPVILRAILEEVRERGYASIEDELDYGVLSVALPIFTVDRIPVAAINCSTSPSRVSREELLETRLPILRETAGRITAELRRHPALVYAILG
jgi:IclR family pca regulon transcriptional regulator